MSLLKQLEAYEKKIKPKLEDVMRKEVADEAIRQGKLQIDTIVYNYQPKAYERTGQLRESWEVEDIDGGAIVRNTREDENTGKYIPPVIETGEGYDYTGYGYGYEQPRPFIQNTRDALMKNDTAKKILKKGLQQRGIKIK